MNTIRRGLIAVVGITVGVLTLRSLRNRRAKTADEAEPIEEARSEARIAIDHAKRAASHAREAGDNVVEYAKRKKSTVQHRAE